MIPGVALLLVNTFAGLRSSSHQDVDVDRCRIRRLLGAVCRRTVDSYSLRLQVRVVDGSVGEQAAGDESQRRQSVHLYRLFHACRSCRVHFVVPAHEASLLSARTPS